MKPSSNVLLAFAALISSVASAKEPCLKYAPEVVQLVGVMRSHRFPGPPNYESVARGDALEVYWFLHLSKSVCVEPSDPSAAPQEPEAEVTSLEIVVPDFEKAGPLLGKRVKITGTLFHAITGHHHTKVLVDASKIEPAL